MDKSSADISQDISDLEKQLKEAIKAKAVVQMAIHLLTKDILLKEIKKKDLMISLSKARDNVRTLEIDINIMKSKFWACKNSGL